MFDLIREISQTIKNNKLRTALTGLAVAWGIFMLIVLLGAARGVVNSYEDQSANSSVNSIRLWSGTTSMPYKGYKDGRWIRLRDKDMDAISGEVSAVSDVAISTSASGFNIVGPKDYISGGFEAVYPDVARTQRITDINGRFINQKDINDHRRTIVIHRDNAALLFGDADKALGEEVRAMDLSWKVVGVYSHRWRKGSFVPYTTYKAITGGNGYVDEMAVRVDGIATETEAEEAEAQVRSVLARRHDFDPDDSNAVWVWNQFANYIKQGKALVYLNLAVWVIGILTLLTGIVGVSNIMFVSVRERVHEIGIRRAIGAKPKSIIVQILAESVAITALFGYIGLVAGMIVLQILDALLGDADGFSNPTVDISLALQVTVALIVAGAIAGLFPAIKATKVKPVEALRDE
ncbi:MAG: ABC transporter permease [Muribaculaceae bacterium]|nr:ABC transporter permease [Muribaculaceae bacterium]